MAYKRPSPLRAITWLVLLFIIVLLSWSFVAKVPEVARTRGQVEPLGDLVLIQSLEGGQIVDILVQEGQAVEKGAPLMRFEPLQTETDVRQLESRTVFLNLEAERLQAFVEERDPDFSDYRAKYPVFVAQQERLLDAKRREMHAELRALQEQLSQKKQSRAALDKERLVLLGQIESAKSVTDIYKDLAKKNVATKLELINAEQRESEFRKELESINGTREVLIKEMQEIEEQKSSVKESMFSAAEQARAAILSELAEADQRLNERQTSLERLLIVSPAKGIIKQLQYTKPGAVVNPSEVLAEIVPLDVGLVVEVQISPRDIGFVHVGQDVTIRVDTYDYARYGVLNGVLSKLSPTTFKGPKGELYYVGEVSPEQAFLGDNPDMSRLLPGMTAEVDIITGEKTIFQYLLKPVFTLAHQSFKER